MERGKKLLETGDLEDARQIFRSAQQINPDSVESLYFLALIHEAEGERSEATAMLMDVVEEEPRHVPARLELGHYAYEAKMLEQALTHASVAVAAEPENPAAHSLRAAIYFRRDQLNLARSEAMTALAIDPASVSATSVLASIHKHHGKPAEAIQTLQRGIEQNPDNLALRELSIECLIEQGKFDAAADLYREMIGIDPANLAHPADLAKHYIASGDLEAAEALLRQTVARLPSSDRAKLLLIDFLTNQRSPDDATTEFQYFLRRQPDNDILRFGYAEFLVAHDREDQAETELQRVIEHGAAGRTLLAAGTELARLRLAAGDFTAADGLIAETLREDPTLGAALIVAAQIRLARGRPREAIADLTKIAPDDPSYRQALHVLSDAHLLDENLGAASQTLSPLLDARPLDREAWLRASDIKARQGDLARALSMIDQVLEQSPDWLPALRAKTEHMIAAEDYPAARVMARRVSRASNNPALGYQLLGKTALGEGNHEAARRAFLSAHGLAPASREILIGFAEAYLRDGNLPGLKARLAALLAKDPSNAALHNALGETYLRGGEIRMAEQSFREAARHREAWVVPYYNLGKLKLEANDPDAAIEEFQQGLRRAPNDIDLRLSLAIAFARAGDHAMAITTYEDLLHIFPNDWRAANGLAAMIADYEYGKAARLEQALALVVPFRESRDPYLLDTLGWVQFRMGNLDDAISVLSRAVELAPDLPIVRYHLGLAYYAGKQFGPARAALQQALLDDNLLPQADHAREVLKSLRSSD